MFSNRHTIVIKALMEGQTVSLNGRSWCVQQKDDGTYCFGACGTRDGESVILGVDVPFHELLSWIDDMKDEDVAFLAMNAALSGYVQSKRK